MIVFIFSLAYSACKEFITSTQALSVQSFQSIWRIRNGTHFTHACLLNIISSLLWLISGIDTLTGAPFLLFYDNQNRIYYHLHLCKHFPQKLKLDCVNWCLYIYWLLLPPESLNSRLGCMHIYYFCSPSLLFS